MERETRPGSPHLPSDQMDEVEFYQINTVRSKFDQEGGGGEEIFAAQRCRLCLLPHCGLDQLHNVEGLQGMLFYLIIISYFVFTTQVGLLPTDLFDITGPDDAAMNAKRFERIWEEEKETSANKSQKPSLSRSLCLTL